MYTLHSCNHYVSKHLPLSSIIKWNTDCNQPSPSQVLSGIGQSISWFRSLELDLVPCLRTSPYYLLDKLSWVRDKTPDILWCGRRTVTSHCTTGGPPDQAKKFGVTHVVDQYWGSWCKIAIYSDVTPHLPGSWRSRLDKSEATQFSTFPSLQCR